MESAASQDGDGDLKKARSGRKRPAGSQEGDEGAMRVRRSGRHENPPSAAADGHHKQVARSSRCLKQAAGRLASSSVGAQPATGIKKLPAESDAISQDGDANESNVKPQGGGKKQASDLSELAGGRRVLRSMMHTGLAFSSSGQASAESSAISEDSDTDDNYSVASAMSQDSDSDDNYSVAQRRRKKIEVNVSNKAVGRRLRRKKATGLASSSSGAAPAEECLESSPAKRVKRDQGAKGGSTTTTVKSMNFTFRCSPHRMQKDMVMNLVPDMKGELAKTQFHGVAQIQLTKPLCPDLVHFLVERVDPATGTLELGPDRNIKIEIKPLMQKVMGLSDRGSVIPVEHFGGGPNTKKSKFIFGTQKHGWDNRKSFLTLYSACYPDGQKRSVGAASLGYELRGNRDRCNVLRICALVALAFVVAPNTSLNVDQRFCEVIWDVDKLNQWNLCDFSYELLMKGIRDIRNGIAAKLVGCPYILIVIFLDMLKGLKIPGGFPRVKYIKDKHLERLNSCKQDWANLELKDLKDTVYYNGSGDQDDEEEDDKHHHGTNKEQSHITFLRSDHSDVSMPTMQSMSRDLVTKLKNIKAELAAQEQLIQEGFKSKPEALDADYTTKLMAAMGMFPNKDDLHTMLHDCISATHENYMSTALLQNKEYTSNIIALETMMNKFMTLVSSTSDATLSFISRWKAENAGAVSEKVVEVEQLRMHYPAADIEYVPVPVSCEDLKSLEPGKWLVDPIMAVYTLHLHEVLPLAEIEESKIRGQYLITDTFFFTKLKEGGPENVSEWFKNPDMHGKRYLFIIVYDGPHWSLVIVHKPTNGVTGPTTLLHLDSMEGIHDREEIFNVIIPCLQENLGIGSDITTEICSVPQQQNTCDCGILTLYNIQRVILEVGIRFDVKTFKEKVFHEECYDPKHVAAALRERIKCLMQENKLKITQQGKCGSCTPEEHKRFTDATWPDAFVL